MPGHRGPLMGPIDYLLIAGLVVLAAQLYLVWRAI
jgi:hypothetical protein